MLYKGPYCYTLLLTGNENNRVISKKIYDGKETNFKTPVTKDRTPKIYILKYKKKIVYVGYASQSIGKRLGQGIRAAGINGYHGYKWKQHDEIELLIFVFKQQLKGSKHDDDKPYVNLAEAIEAELVYKVRSETGLWPEYQNEIHFNNEKRVEVLKLANEIYNKIISHNHASKINNWFEPDATWEIVGIPNRKDYVKKFVVEGKFHKNVPEDIVKAFTIVTYLMAHSYYHYPMYDEAMSKALLVMEMAVKIKAKELGIALKLPPNKNGVEYDKRLEKLIDEVCLTNHLSFLKPDFDRARFFRNHKVHPEQYSFSGVLGYTHKNVKLFIKILNLLFMEGIQLEKLLEKRNDLKNKMNVFKDGLFVLEFNNREILIDRIHEFKYLENEGIKLLLLFVNPLSKNVYENLKEHKFEEPLIIALKEFNIKNYTIEGVDLKNQSVKIYPSMKMEDKQKLFMYNNDISRVSKEDMHLFINFNSNRAMWLMEDIIYENCWN